MTTRLLLDTNVLSSLIRDPRGPVAMRLATVGDAQVFTNGVVAGELRLGTSTG